MGAVLTTGWAGVAAASPGPHDMVTVLWDETECMTLVDRSTRSAELPLSYALPTESPMAGESKCPDEPEESRTIQFIAFCEDPGKPSASRVYSTDVDASQLPTGAVLETSDACWVEITTADTRQPMQFASHEDPLVWNTADVEPGAYSVWAFSLVPPFIAWTRRTRNIVKIHDGDPHAVGPALALTSAEMVVDVGEAATVEGCIHALPGTTLSAEFTTLVDGDWAPFVEDVAVEGNTFALAFAPPEAGSFNVRVTATDPQGRSFVAYAPSVVSSIEMDGACEEGSTFLPCPEPDATSTGEDESSGGDTDEPSSDGESSSACSTGGDPPWLCAFFVVAIRRRARTRRDARRAWAWSRGQPRPASRG